MFHLKTFSFFQSMVEKKGGGRLMFACILYLSVSNYTRAGKE